jgi:thiaminase/transcriptional activator TenA
MADADTTLFARLRAACGLDWAAYVEHRFVAGLGDGSLPEACFRHYLVQDYRFLIHFARAYGLAAYKADDLDDIRQAAAGLGAIIDTEIGLHVGFCAGWGLSESDLAAAPEDTACMAYTRFVLERGAAGDLLDLHVALAPCIVGYAEIGRRLAAEGDTRASNPYAEWIAMYASEDYAEVAAGEIATLDRLMERRGGPRREAGLVTIFRQATRLEAAFWQMGLDAA